MEELNNVQPQTTEGMNENELNVNENNLNEGSQQQDLPKIKVKFNHEEMELPYEEAVKHIQKGMNYDKVYEKVQALENDPRLGLINKLAEQSGMTSDEFISAVEEQQRLSDLNDLVSNNIPEEFAQEILENRKFRAVYQAEQTEKQKQEQLQQTVKEFLTIYPDVKTNEIPQNVWDEVNQGKNLIDAYAKHENNTLKTRLAELQQKLNINQSNINNEQSSTGSVTGHGEVENVHYTREQVSKMSTQEVMKNYNAIMKSRKTW